MIGRRIIFLAAVLIIPLASVFAAPSIARAQDTQNFTFDIFTANYYLNREADRSSRLTVNEVLVAHFPDFDQNHGILRAIPERYKDHSLSLKIISVTNEHGMPHPYTTYQQNDNKVLKIGNPDAFVRGKVTYKINYAYKDVISFEPGHDEFFWDINGDQWPQSFGQVTARVHVDDELVAAVASNPICYAGSFGERISNCTVSSLSEGSFTASAVNLQPRQTLSTAIKFKKGSFALSQAVKNETLYKKISLIAAAFLAVGLPLGAFIFMFRRWRQFGDDPKGRGVIVPQYGQPKGLDALTADYLYKQALRPEAISALLIELAVGGFINVYEIPKKGLFGKKDYELELKKLPEHTPQFVAQAIRVVFDSTAEGSKVKMSDLKDSSRRQDTYERMKKLEESLADNLHTRGYFMKNPKGVKAGYKIWGVLLAIAGGASVWAAVKLEVWALGGLAAGLIIAGIIVYIYAFFMPARTQKGVEDYDMLLGLEDYIKTAEADRLKYLQSPEGAEKISDKEAFDPKTDAAKIKLFESLLPYAMLFGLEKKWAKQFEHIYTKAPDWYHGSSSAFHAGYLGSSLSDFRGSSASTFTSPSSSGSGFGGGGAGGGGGGGGGGGW